jgi:glycosyltransferase involved in cell wall biosynthesis
MNKFIVVVPFYNVEQWIKTCLSSAKKQTYKNFTCIVIDDISTDNSSLVVEKFIKDDDRFIFVKNTEKKYALRNIYDAILSANPSDEDIIVTLDGDDWFASEDVLNILNSYYNDENCYMTYGSYKEFPTNLIGRYAKQIPSNIINTNDYRNHEWCSSHLRSFKYKIWKRIDKQDLVDSSGQFYRMTWDLAIMFPMLEMCGNKAKYVKEILYIYNLNNPINDHKVDNTLQIKLEMEIRRKNKYNLL